MVGSGSSSELHSVALLTLLLEVPDSFSVLAVNGTPKGEEMVELESSSSGVIKSANAANTSTSSSDAGVASPPKRLRTRGTKSVLSLISSEPLTETGSVAAKPFDLWRAYGK
ncbi:hypothetical protein GWK47_003993 [Chionoecetes opilio]|uniref:Uncharacterized protein n=1 Tax=Chionoecetes opilio TaxID=41210 RepID=A0A8J4YG23_CHIOP|nr:hypothetical protein GWK47_003993 [Chionoecetes opilio]